MSDDTNNNASTTNGGYTLPNSSNATHNAGLSPFFMTRSGGHNLENYGGLAIAERGDGASLWSHNAHSGWGYLTAYYLGFTNALISPSGFYGRFLINPLRCLVSTTNSK